MSYGSSQCRSQCAVVTLHFLPSLGISLFPRAVKNILSLVAFFILPAAVQAAITVTISPGATGTRFSIIQTSQNPTLVFDNLTVGYVSSISLAPGSFDQDPTVVGYTATFTPTIGLMTNVPAGDSEPVRGFRFLSSLLYSPALDLQNPILMGASQSHRFEITNSVTSEISISFDHFVEGSYVESDPIFGTVTTVVVPEPTTALLGLLAPGLLFRRRR